MSAKTWGGKGGSQQEVWRERRSISWGRPQACTLWEGEPGRVLIVSALPSQGPPSGMPGPLGMRVQWRIICLLWRPYRPLLLYPVASPAKGGSQPLREPAPLSGLLSGLSLQRLLWAAGPQSWLPCVCLSPALSSPNAACPSWGVHCLPAACLPACSMPKPSACRLLERTNPLPGPAPPPNPVSPRGAVPAGIHHPQDAGPAWGPAPVLIGPSSAGQTGRLTVEPGDQRVAPPDPGTEHGAARSLGPLSTVSPGWSTSFLLGSQVQCCPQDQSPG